MGARDARRRGNLRGGLVILGTQGYLRPVSQGPITMRTALTALIFALATPALAGDIVIEDAYARASPPGAPTGAAYMVIRNEGDAADRLIGVRSDAAAMTEVHANIDAGNGVMQMRPVEDGIEIPGGGRHELARGGDHVMMMGLSSPLDDGGTVTLTLVFENAGEIEVVVPVDNARGQAGN